MLLDVEIELLHTLDQPNELNRSKRIEQTEMLKRKFKGVPLWFFTTDELRPLNILYTDGHAYQTLKPEEFTCLLRVAERLETLKKKGKDLEFLQGIIEDWIFSE